MAINFIKKEDLSHITRTTRQWETTIDRYEIIPKGVLCIELCNDKLTKIKIGNGHLIYEQLPYVSDVNLSDYYTKEETNNLIKDLKAIKIKGEASSLSDLPLHGNEEGDLWFIPKSDPDEHNRYDEYIWYNNKWESFGSSDIDLSEYAKKSYVDTHIQEVQDEITEIIESGYLHKHSNKDILDQTSAVYTVEKDNKLRDLHNYDDTELREKAHTHLNKNILDQTDAVYNRDKDDKLSSLHNYDDTDVKDRISTLESVAHSHSNQDILDRTTAAFTKEQALTLLDCKDFEGTDGVHGGRHGFVPAPTASDVGKVLGANGQWVEGGGSGGDVIAQGGGIEITTDSQTGVKTVSVNAGTGLSIDPDTGELNADAQALEPATTTTLGGVIIGDGISVDNDGVIDVNTGDGLSVNNDNELEVSVGDGLQIDANGAVEVSLGNGLQIDANDAIEVNVGDGLSINASDEVELDKATASAIGGVIVGDNIDVSNGTISVPKAASNKLGVIKPSDGLSVDSNGVLTVDTGDGLSIDSTTKEVNVNVGDGLSIDSTNNDINVNTGRALSINSSTKAVDVDIASNSSYGCVKIGEGIDVDQYGIISVDKMVPFRAGNGLELVDESVRLPSGYAKVKYVENPSGAAIAAPFNPRSCPNAKVAVKFSRTSLSSSGNIEYVFGAEIYVSGGRYFNLGFFNKTADTLPLYAGFVYGSNTWNTQTDANGGRSTDIDIGDIIYAECSVGEGLKMNNEQIHNVTNVGGESLPYIDLGVFANRRRVDQYTIYTENCFVGRIYSFKIYDGKNVILNLIPAVRLSDNAVGFYSYTNNTFYPSITEVPFTTDMETLDIEVPDWVMNVTPATTDTIGGIKVGSGLSATNDGTLSVNTGDGLTVNNNNELETKLGDGLSFDANNEISVVTGDGIVIDENGAVALEEQPKEYHAGEAISIETVGGLQLTDYSNDAFVTSIASMNAGSIVKAADNSSFTLTASNNDCYTRGPSGEANGSYPYNVKASTKYRLTWDSSSDVIHGKVYTYENGLYDTWMHEIDQYDQKYLEFTTKAETTFITTRFGVMYAGDSITYSNVRLYEVIEDEDAYDEISVKYGDGLTVNQNNELEVSYGNGLEISSNSQYRPEYYFNTQVQCQVHTDNPVSGFPSDRTYQKTTTEPALCCIWEVGNSGTLWTGPLLVGTTTTSVQYTTADTQQTVTYQNTFQYLGQTWYTSGYPDFLNAADHEDKLGNLQYLGSYAAVTDQIQAAKDLIDLALINAGSLQAKIGAGLQFDANGAIEVVNSGTEYTAGDGIDINASDEISVKIGNHLSFDQTTGDINVDDIIEYHGGAATEVVNAAEFTIDKIRWNVSAIRSNSGSEIWIQLRYFGFYDEEYNRFPVSSGVSTWSDGSTVEYYQNRTIESLIANTERLCAKTWNGVRTFTMTFNLTSDISSDDLKYFRYYTGDDESGRDPVSWTIEVHDKVADTWTQVQTVTGATIPTGRNQWTSYFDLNLPPSDGKKINVLVGDGLFIDSTNNDVNVKIGQALSINNSNEIDVNLGRALSINNNNEIDVDIATATTLGVVKAGSGLNIDEFGNLSTQATPFRIGRALSLDDESVRLPSAYYKAKYVESDGSANTTIPFYPSSYPNAKCVVKASIEEISDGYRHLFGTERQNTWTGAYSLCLYYLNTDTTMYSRFNYATDANNNVYAAYALSYGLGDIIDIECSRGEGLKINNEVIQTTSASWESLSSYELAIFGLNVGNGVSSGAKGRIYSFKVYNGDTLIHNLVPAVRKSDNVVGFYNTSNNTFYSSIQSTEFTTDMDDLDVDDPDWVLNASIATSNSLGVVKPSTGLVVNEHGALTLDKASASTIGGVKVGNNLSIDSNGVLTANIINYSSGHAIEITGDLSIDKFRWEITKNAGDSMVAFRYFEYSDSSHIPFTIQAGTIEWSDGSTVSYPSGYDETFAGMMENRTKCTVTGWTGTKTLIMTFTLSQSIMLSDIAYFRWKTDDYMSGRQPQEFNIYAHDSVNDEWILLKEVTDHALVPSSSNTWSTYIDIEPEIEPGAINVKYGNGLTLNQNNELEVPVASSSTLGIVKIGHGVEIDPYGAIYVDAMVPFAAGVGLELIPGSSSEDALPEGYGKVDYIESNGNAYTIIDYKPNSNTKVVGTSLMLNSTRDPVVFGARTSGNGQQFVFWFNTYSNTYAKVGFVYGTNTWSTSTDAADGRLVVYTLGTKFTYTISLEDELIIDDSFVHNITDNGTPPNMKLGIFALTHTDTSIESDDTIFSGRMYDFKIYENNELVVNLVPAVRLEDDKVGFYDNIGNKFYPSLGSTQFTTDMSSMVIDYNETTMNVRLGEGLKTNSYNNITLDLHAGNGINLAAYGSDLPVGYGELSYIEGNGNQWTQLDYYPTHDSRLVVDCISYETNSTDRALFGCREGTGGQPQFILWAGQKTSGYVTASFVYGSNVWDDDYNTGVAVGERFTVDASYNGVYINGDLFESITDQGNMPNLKVALFTVGNGDGSYISGKGMGKYRIYSFKIYEGNDLVVDLRPALSPIHIPGFYDVVNDVFYSSLTNTAFVYDSGSVVYPSGLQLTTKIGDGLAYDANGAITVAESADAFVAGDGIKFTNLSQTNKIKLVISAIRSTSQSGANAPYTQMRYVEFYDENLDPISIASGEAIWSDGTTVVYSEQIYSLSAMLNNTNKMCICDYKPSLVLTFTLSSAMNAENIKYFRYKTGNDVSERDPVSWKIYVNDVNAQTSWTQISEAVSETITTSRDTWTQYFTCEFTAGGVTSISVRPATASTLGGVIVGNGLTVTSDGTISTVTGKAYIAGEGINMSSSQYEFSAENEQYLFKSQVTCELHGDFNREFQKYTDDTALGMVWNVYNSGTLWSGPLFVGLSADAVKYTANSTTYSALGTFSYLGKTWYYSDTQMYVSNIDGTDYDGNMVVDTETYASESDIVQACKSLIDRARVILKVDEISLLPATEDTLGGIKIGEGLSIDENNVVSSTVYEEGQGITFETSGSTDSFDVKNKQYYFEDEARCQITGNFGPRAYWRVYTDDPCLAVIFYRSDTTTAPLYIGLTENSVKMYQSWDGNVLGPTGTFAYKGYSWYYTYDYGLYYSSGVDQLGHLQTISGSSSDDEVDVAKHVIDLAELINPGIKTYDVWGDGTGWLNGAYNDSQSDQFWTNWYYTYHSNQNEYLEVPTGAIKMRLIGISNENDSRFQGGGVDCFDASHHHFASVGCITDEWVDIPLGTVYLQFGVKWNELNDRTISSSDIKSVTLEIKVPKNNAITAKLGDGLTFDENDAITLDESIKLIIHCVGTPLT